MEDDYTPSIRMLFEDKPAVAEKEEVISSNSPQ
jgi:hypothetical protein